MEVKHCVRLTLLVVALFMFCYQVQFAVKSIMDPPLMVTTSGTTISEITPPLMYLCPLNQFDIEKVKAFDYGHETLILEGIMYSQSKGYFRSWGSHRNLTFEQLIRNVIKEAPKDIEFGNILSSPKLFPKFGNCFQVDYNAQNSFLFPDKADFLNDYTMLLTDKSTRTYFSVNMASQLGDKIRIFKNNPSIYSFFVDIEIYEAAQKKTNCNPDPNYSYEHFVDEQVHADLKPRMKCVLPYLSEGDHCQNLSKKYKPEIKYCGIKYVTPYIILGETKGLPETLYQQQISVSLRDQTPSSMSNASTILL